MRSRVNPQPSLVCIARSFVSDDTATTATPRLSNSSSFDSSSRSWGLANGAVKPAIEHEKGEMRRLLACKIEGAAASEINLKRWNGPPWKQWHEICHVAHSFSVSFIDQNWASRLVIPLM